MPNIASILKEEIRRLAKKEIRGPDRCHQAGRDSSGTDIAKLKRSWTSRAAIYD